jgi:hypothetical protein
MRNDQRRVSHVGVFVIKQLSIVIAVLGLLLVTVSARADEVSDGAGCCVISLAIRVILGCWLSLQASTRIAAGLTVAA